MLSPKIAEVAVMIGEAEFARQEVVVKCLSSRIQETCSLDSVPARVMKFARHDTYPTN